MLFIRRHDVFEIRHNVPPTIDINDNLWRFRFINATLLLNANLRKKSGPSLQGIWTHTTHSYRCLWRNSAWKLLWLERNATSPGCLQTVREYWWKFGKLNVMCGLTLRQTEWRHYTNTHLTDARKQAAKPLDGKRRRELAVSFKPSISPSSSLPPPSITPHVWDMLSWKRLAALRVYKWRRGFVQFLSSAFRLLKQNKASWRKRTWEREKWKLIIFLHVLPFISLHMYLSVLISSLSPVMTRFTISHFDNKVKVSQTQRHMSEVYDI